MTPFSFKGYPSRERMQMKVRASIRRRLRTEAYLREHSDAEFSHSICKECAEKYYPDMDLYDD